MHIFRLQISVHLPPPGCHCHARVRSLLHGSQRRFGGQQVAGQGADRRCLADTRHGLRHPHRPTDAGGGCRACWRGAGGSRTGGREGCTVTFGVSTAASRSNCGSRGGGCCCSSSGGVGVGGGGGGGDCDAGFRDRDGAPAANSWPVQSWSRLEGGSSETVPPIGQIPPVVRLQFAEINTVHGLSSISCERCATFPIVEQAVHMAALAWVPRGALVAAACRE